MSETRCHQQTTPTNGVAESCEQFGREIRAAFVGRPHWITAAIAPTSIDSFERSCLEPDRVVRFPLGLALTALRVVIRREGIAAAQRILDIALRPLGLVTVPAEERANASRSVEQEMLEAQVATSRLFVAVADAKADGHVDDRERRVIAEAARDAKNEIDDIAEVMS